MQKTKQNAVAAQDCKSSTQTPQAHLNGDICIKKDNIMGATSEAQGRFHTNFGINSQEAYVAIPTVCMQARFFKTQAKTV